jgi:hypothetical protein
MRDIRIAEPIAKARQRILEELQALHEIVQSSPNRVTTLDKALMEFIEQRLGAKVLIFEDALTFSQAQSAVKKALGAWDCLLFSSKYPVSSLEERISTLSCLALGVDSAIVPSDRLLIYVTRCPALAFCLGLRSDDPKVMNSNLVEPLIQDWLTFVGLQDVKPVPPEIADLHTEFLFPFDDSPES